MNDAESERRINREVEDGTLVVTVSEPREFRGFDGEATEAEVQTHEIELPDDPEFVEEVGHALLGWSAEEQPAGPPGQKPIHQQMNEAYNR